MSTTPGNAKMGGGTIIGLVLCFSLVIRGISYIAPAMPDIWDSIAAHFSHRATVMMEVDAIERWILGERRNCELHIVIPELKLNRLICEKVYPGIIQTAHEVPVKFYGRTDRKDAHPPKHNNWTCRRNAEDFTCWAVN